MKQVSETQSADDCVSPPLTEQRIGDAVRALHENGYVVLRNVVPKIDLEKLRVRLLQEYEIVSHTSRLPAGGGSISGHLNCFPGEESRFCFDAIQKHGILKLIRAAQPGAELLMRVGGNFNLPGSCAQHYHADGVFTENFLIVNVAVVDTDIRNGAIDVLPGTQKKFYKFWRYAVERAYLLTTRVPVKQGDVIVRTSTMWHRGMPNATSEPRPMVALTFGERDEQLTDPYLKDEGKITFHPNWYRPTLAGRLRERTFVAVPISYSVFRFVRSLMGNKGY